LPTALGSRARIVIASAAGEPNNAIAERLTTTKQTVGKWCTRFIERRIAGLYDVGLHATLAAVRSRLSTIAECFRPLCAVMRAQSTPGPKAQRHRRSGRQEIRSAT
jgi:hypothetical protein